MSVPSNHFRRVYRCKLCQQVFSLDAFGNPEQGEAEVSFFTNPENLYTRGTSRFIVHNCFGTDEPLQHGLAEFVGAQFFAGEPYAETEGKKGEAG